MAYIKQKSIKVTVLKAISYIVDEEKTQDGSLVYGVNCSINPKIANKQMEIVRENHKKNSGILAHHFVQSFKPNEIKDINTAYEIGIRLAEKLTDEKFKAIVVTHTDKEHIHNHIIMNSVNSEGKKYFSNKESLQSLRDMSDEILKEKNLSIIENKEKNEKGKSYKEWKEDKKGNSWKSNTKKDIDKYINEVKNFEELISILKEKGYEVKHGENVKYIAFKYPNQQRFTRGKTIGEDYTEEKIKERIKENLENNKFIFKTFMEKDKKNIQNNRFPRITRANKFIYKKANLSNNIVLTMLLIKELLNKNQIKCNPRKVSYVEKSVKNLEKTLYFINDKNINSTNEISNEINKINEKINKVDKLIQELNSMSDKLNTIKIHIEKYKKNEEIYNKYKQKNFFTKKIFFKNNVNQINEFENAKSILDKLNIKVDSFEKIYVDLKSIEENIEKYRNKNKNLKESKKEIENIFKNINEIKYKKIVDILKDNKEKYKNKGIEK